MSGARDAFQERVRAFRDETAAPADGRATRARVLAAAVARERGSGRPRRAWRRAVAAAALVLSSAAAFTAIGRWRTASTARRPEEVAGAAVVAPARRVPELRAPVPSIATPPIAAPAAPPTQGATGRLDEEGVYGRAHKLHFGGAEPRAVLAAWDEYLERHPRGAFVPEARYNRALTLLRLGRREQAVQALRPFAAGAFGAYRRDEAALLIEAVTGR